MAAFDMSRLFQGLQGSQDHWSTVYSPAGDPRTFDAQSGAFAGVTPEASQGLGNAAQGFQQAQEAQQAQMQAQHAQAMKAAAAAPQQSAFAPAQRPAGPQMQPKSKWWEV